MTTSLDLLNLVHAATIVNGATAAGARVFKPGDWPTQPGQYPNFKLRLLSEDRQSIARSSAPEFITTAIIRVVGEVSEPAAVDNGGATAAETALWALKRQFEVAVINSYPLTSEIQQIVSIRASLAFNSEGPMHLAGIQIDLALEFYEGPECFAPVIADDLDEMRVADTNHEPVDFKIDLQP